MGLVMRRLPDDLYRDLGMKFRGQVRPFSKIVENYSPTNAVVYQTSGLPSSNPSSLVLKTDNSGSVEATVGGAYARFEDRPDMGGEVKRATRAWNVYARQNPGLYTNTPFHADGKGSSRTKFYDKRGFVSGQEYGNTGLPARMYLDTRPLAPYTDQQVYAAMDPYIQSKYEIPFLAKSRARFMGTRSDPWSGILQPTLYDSSGSLIDVPSGSFSTIARAAFGEEERKRWIDQMRSQQQASMARQFQPNVYSYRQGIVEFPVNNYSSPVTRDIADVIPATWVNPYDSLLGSRNPGYASPVPISNPLDITPARRQALAQAGYSDPNQWFLRYYNAPQGKIRYYSQNQNRLDDWVANNDSWDWR